ncbi:MAG: hypothetical protein IT290_03550 [Deltaproteobacteria bacterium]|nr:hypothetical protein [Deltaproteobacteria bacterium]
METHPNIAPNIESTSNEAEACESLRSHGFTESFVFDPPALRCCETGELFQASQIEITGIFRFEGESNPSDMSVIYALEGTTFSGKLRRGILVDAYGAYATPRLGDFLESVTENRGKVAALGQELSKTSGGV